MLNVVHFHVNCYPWYLWSQLIIDNYKKQNHSILFWLWNLLSILSTASFQVHKIQWHPEGGVLLLSGKEQMCLCFLEDNRWAITSTNHEQIYWHRVHWLLKMEELIMNSRKPLLEWCFSHWCSSCDVWGYWSDVRCFPCEVWCHFFDVGCSVMWCLVTFIWCLLIIMWYQVATIWCLVPIIWCLSYVVWCLSYVFWCLSYFFWCQQYDVGCPLPLCNIRCPCLMLLIWYVVPIMWCLVHVMLSSHYVMPGALSCDTLSYNMMSCANHVRSCTCYTMHAIIWWSTLQLG